MMNAVTIITINLIFGSNHRMERVQYSKLDNHIFILIILIRSIIYYHWVWVYDKIYKNIFWLYIQLFMLPLIFLSTTLFIQTIKAYALQLKQFWFSCVLLIFSYEYGYIIGLGSRCDPEIGFLSGADLKLVFESIIKIFIRASCYCFLSQYIQIDWKEQFTRMLCSIILINSVLWQIQQDSTLILQQFLDSQQYATQKYCFPQFYVFTARFYDKNIKIINKCLPFSIIEIKLFKKNIKDIADRSKYYIKYELKINELTIQQVNEQSKELHKQINSIKKFLQDKQCIKKEYITNQLQDKI